MEKFKYKGKEYIRYKGQWMGTDYVIVHDTLQRELNKHFSSTIDLDTLTIGQLLVEGDHFKESGSISIALEYYQKALAKCGKRDRYRAEIYPRITSCWRSQGFPEKAVDLFERLVKEKSFVLGWNPALFTSVGAAYCDLGNWEMGKKLANRANARCKGKASDELISLYRRIKNHNEQ